MACKPVGLVCDDQLYLKPTDADRAIVDAVVEGAPYPGAKPHFMITADRWENDEWLCDLVRATARELPPPKPRKPANDRQREFERPGPGRGPVRER